ncbi:ABC transporter permease [Planococcus sp. CP5-4]|uniref:ABC transporter permease n=1 Tax=unclassified Planococcus (in: firmicutes) TaxID=2662419 RepID=UPI001C21B07E|nr:MULTISPECIES: ABC transporter permease [unclassified Planococcus (in: firmicutes)]MBU9674949.1 ABC transporter permease [Planococcus sp. CP5-4_YE]MBV0908412.1 ABC transporter permease [Planococcus sp. CP5-4_UN]MBW6062626.1 ABC transporter permease [Planococcus sp. CP5-4]
MIQLAKRVIRQTINDKRSVMLILVAPLLILTLVYFLLGDSDYVATVAIDRDAVAAPVITALEQQELNVVGLTAQEAEQAADYLQHNEDVDAVLRFSETSAMDITLYEPSTKGATAMSEIQKAMADLNPSAETTISYVYGTQDQSLFDSLGYVFLALFSFFFVFIISAMALVRERSRGTLERLMMTPIRRGEVIAGYTLGYSVFAIIQAVIIVLYAIFVLQLSNEGNIGWVLLPMVLLAVTAVSFGATISIFAGSELQVVQLIPFTIIPQVFFSGLIPLDLIPYHLGNLSYIMPIYYGAAAIKGIMVYGDGFTEIWGHLAGLTTYALVLYLINTQALKKFRKL